MQRDILPIIKNSNENLLILGKAGVGKSTLIKIVKKHFGKKCVILCPTGIAAQNVNGLTIHSFFNLPIVDSIEKKHIEKSSNILKSIDKFKRLQEIETIIIDEISMVNAMVFDAIDLILKTVYQTTKPFGGKRVILIGDIFQLPPIDKQNSRGDRIFFWNSTAFRQTSYVCTELRKVYRLKDTLENREFERILEKIRVYKTTQPDLDFLNSKYKQNQSINETTVLCSRKDDAKQYNYQGLQGLGKRVYNFKAEYSKEFPENEFPVYMELDLAIGAPVIFIRNDVSSTYKNGTRGKVKAINAEEKKITVRLENNQEVSVGYVEWLPSKYNDLDLAQRAKIKDYFRHFPLILGYAMTIHRCQGMTMTNVHLDLGRGAFAAGQLYVALSRLREINGLTLEKKLQRSDLIQSSETLRFYNDTNFEEVNLNLTGAELSTVDSKNELIKTTQGFQLETKSLSVHLFNQGLNVDEIQQERIRLGFNEILPVTIIGHLVAGYEDIDYDDLKSILNISKVLEESLFEELSEIDDLENKTLTEIRNSLSNPEIDWNQLKFIAYTNKLLVPYKPKTNQKKEQEANLVKKYNNFGHCQACNKKLQKDITKSHCTICWKKFKTIV